MCLNAAVEVWFDQAMKAALAASPETPIWILEGLAGDEDRVVRYLLAGNPAAPVTPAPMCGLRWRPTPAPRSMCWRVCSRTGTRRCGGWLGSTWSTAAEEK